TMTDATERVPPGRVNRFLEGYALVVTMTDATERVPPNDDRVDATERVPLGRRGSGGSRSVVTLVVDETERVPPVAD
ncbi:MAG: hypothetical protein NZ741_10365, partial [Armatimonadetes bacterium]|nr:hypothetical protein [Armatimonadota bacterium]